MKGEELKELDNLVGFTDFQVLKIKHFQMAQKLRKMYFKQRYNGYCLQKKKKDQKLPSNKGLRPLLRYA